MKRRIETIEEVQEIELHTLEYLDQICKENNLRYYLAYGTLLGAVRHQGFIPWDDDIDVWMPREDYDKLQEILNKKQGERYRLITFLNKKDYHRPFIKIIDTRTEVIEHTDYDVKYGLWVDIFPLDFAGDTKEEGFQNLKWIQNHCGRIVSSGMPLKGLPVKKKCGRLVWRIVFSLLGRRRMFEKYVDTLRTKKNQSMVISSFGELKEKEVFPSEWFMESKQYTFCGKEFPSIAKYDEFLTQFYGDYMILPPEEERVWHPMEAYKFENE